MSPALADELLTTGPPGKPEYLHCDLVSREGRTEKVTFEGGEGVKHAGIWEKELLAGRTTSANVRGERMAIVFKERPGSLCGWSRKRRRVGHG